MAEIRVHARNDYIGTEAERGALSLPSDAIGTRFWATDTDVLAVWDGSAWQEIGSEGGGSGGDFHWHIEGALSALTGVGAKWVVPRDCTIEKVIIYVEDTGSAGNTVVDVNQNGSSIYTVSTKPTVAYDDADGIDSRVPDTVELDADDVVSFDIDSVGTGAAGLDVVVVIG